jgi:hypothetical protein
MSERFTDFGRIKRIAHVDLETKMMILEGSCVENLVVLYAVSIDDLGSLKSLTSANRRPRCQV